MNYKQISRKKLNIVSEETFFKSEKLTCSKEVSNYLRNFYFDDIEIFESFFMIMLNRANIVESYVKISQGGCIGTVVDLKLISHYAINCLAQSVILCHNHPSGNLNPSTQDIDITKKVKNALSLFEINVIDHIILTKDGYYSFSDEGIL